MVNLFLTDRYLHLKEQLTSITNKIEIQIRPDGKVLINGMIRDIDLRTENEFYMVDLVTQRDRKKPLEINSTISNGKIN